MQLKSKNRERLFWSLQLIGWGMINALIFIMPFGFSKTYIVFSFIAVLLIGVGVTSVYRFYLKKNVGLDGFGKRDVLRLIGAFFVCCASFYLLAIVAELLYENIWTRTETELSWFKKHMTITIGIVNTMVNIFGWTLIYYAIKFILDFNQNKLESLELNAILREAQMNALKGQVNPHFMFNSLNNIRGLMLEDVTKSRDMMTKLSEMLQYALSKKMDDAIELKEELEMVENYIALSKIQMEDRLEFIKEVAPETLNIAIPPMIIQLLIENAAKHGISNLKDGGIISLKTSTVNNNLYITVTNTGKLQLSEGSTQLGLQNIEQRLRLLYDKKASFSLEEVENEVVAKIKIPLS